jgi:hypothetical protein
MHDWLLHWLDVKLHFGRGGCLGELLWVRHRTDAKSGRAGRRECVGPVRPGLRGGVSSNESNE